jgi:MFS family permease
MKAKFLQNKKVNDALFILWAGGAALLSYSLVYALRKPYTAASFDGMDVFGMDYKVVVTMVQIVGYLIAKFVGIKLISELKKENRFSFFLGSVLIAELSLLLFGLIPAPYNIVAMFLNGLSLGCMWGVIFSFLEGRRVTDLLVSLLGVSIVISSGASKSVGLFVMNELNVDVFWMPAIVGAIAIPFLVLMAYMLKKLPPPTQEDIELRTERVTLNSEERKALFKRYSPILILLFVGNLLLLVLRDIKEDFLVNIIDMSDQSSWLFAQVDSVVTFVILGLFALLTFFRNNFNVIIGLLLMVVVSCIFMSYISYNYESMQLSTVTWLFLQSLTLYISYLAFQTIFFERFIACFKIRGNVGFFIAIIDFIGYAGTVLFLLGKGLLDRGTDTDWFAFYNNIAFSVSLLCVVLFTAASVLLIKEYQYSVTGKRSTKKVFQLVLSSK